MRGTAKRRLFWEPVVARLVAGMIAGLLFFPALRIIYQDNLNQNALILSTLAVLTGLLTVSVAGIASKHFVTRELRRLAASMRRASEMAASPVWAETWDEDAVLAYRLDPELTGIFGMLGDAFDGLLENFYKLAGTQHAFSSFSTDVAAAPLEVEAVGRVALESMRQHLHMEYGIMYVRSDSDTSSEMIPVASIISNGNPGVRGFSAVPSSVFHFSDLLAPARESGMFVEELNVGGETFGVLVVRFTRNPRPEILSSCCNILATSIARTLEHERIQRLAETDPLTGLSNRRALTRSLSKEHARTLRSSGELGLVMFDIDHFKKVNDTYGHAVGDKVLVAVAQATQEVLRPSDTVGRIGGEEFLIVTPDTNPENLKTVAERIRERIEQSCLTIIPGGVTVSLGIACGPSPNGPDRLIEIADSALYEAKRAGRNRIRFGECSKRISATTACPSECPSRSLMTVTGQSLSSQVVPLFLSETRFGEVE